MILPLALILCFMVGCQQGEEAMAELEEFKAQAAVEEQNKALFLQYYEVWQKGDIEALKEILSPDYVWHQASGQNLSLEQTLESVRQQNTMFSDRSFSAEDLIAKGNKVVLRYIIRETHTGDVEGFPATGNRHETSGIEIIRVESGKIVESWESFDNLSFYQQLGMEPKPKEDK